MDVSKLPRLSGEKKDAAPDLQPVLGSAEMADSETCVLTAAPPRRAPGIPGEAWISFVVGAFLWYWQPRMLQWIASRIFHTSFNEFVLDGAIVPYRQVPEFWMDLGPALFGLILILDGLVLAFARTRLLITAAFSLTLLATGYNLVYVFATYSKYGAAPISFLAAGLGAYIAYCQWQMLRGMQPAATQKSTNVA